MCWAGVTWLFNVVTYPPLDILKFVARYLQTGKPWEFFMEGKTAFTRQKNYGREARQAQWALLIRPGDGAYSPALASNAVPLASSGHEAATGAKRRAEIARLAEIYNLKGHAEAVAKFKALEGGQGKPFYTV